MDGGREGGSETKTTVPTKEIVLRMYRTALEIVSCFKVNYLQYTNIYVASKCITLKGKLYTSLEKETSSQIDMK